MRYCLLNSAHASTRDARSLISVSRASPSTAQLLDAATMPADPQAIRRRFDRINYEEPKTAEDHPFVAACLLFVFVFFFVSV